VLSLYPGVDANAGVLRLLLGCSIRCCRCVTGLYCSASGPSSRSQSGAGLAAGGLLLLALCRCFSEALPCCCCCLVGDAFSSDWRLLTRPPATWTAGQPEDALQAAVYYTHIGCWPYKGLLEEAFVHCQWQRPCQWHLDHLSALPAFTKTSGCSASLAEVQGLSD